MLDSEANLVSGNPSFRFPSPIQDSEKQSDDFPAEVLLLRFLLGEYSSFEQLKLNVVCVDIANITCTNVNNSCAGCPGVEIAGEDRLPWKCS